MSDGPEVPAQREPRERWTPITPVIGCDIPDYPGVALFLVEEDDNLKVVDRVVTSGSIREQVCKYFCVDEQSEIAECPCAKDLSIKTRYVDFPIETPRFDSCPDSTDSDSY